MSGSSSDRDEQLKSRDYDYTGLIDEWDLSKPVELAYPVLWVGSTELKRVEDVYRDIARILNKLFVVMPFKEVPHSKYLDSLMSQSKSEEKSGVIVFDHSYQERQKSNPGFVPTLRSAIAQMETDGVTYILIGSESIKEEFVHHVDFPSITRDEIEATLTVCEGVIIDAGNLDTASDGINLAKPSDSRLFSDEDRVELINNVLGMSDMQIKNALMFCALNHRVGKPYLQKVRAERQRSLRDAGLDVLEPGSPDDIGGLDIVKAFLEERRAGWDRNLPVKGIMLAGVPGGGKSLVAKAAAAVLRVPLVRMDMGRFYSKYVGETEQKFRNALSALEQISPVVVFIDEMDKTFGDGAGEHEVSKRLLGEFLYWLQERTAKVFIVATANRVSRLPAELTRSGRWDACFFVDLPTDTERESILKIHLARHGVELSDADIYRAIAETSSFTGAEIEQAVVNALYKAAAKDCEVTVSHLMAGIEGITALAVSRAGDIAAIQELQNEGFIRANSRDHSEPGAASEDADGCGSRSGRRGVTLSSAR